MNHDFKSIGNAFGLHGDLISAEPYGSGHINDTFAVVYRQAGTVVRYIFQRINDRIFKQVPELMDNIRRVTEHQQERLRREIPDDASRRSLTVIPVHDGAPYHRDESGSYWRAYFFIEGARTYDLIETTAQARAAAGAFARFQRELADLPGDRLFETVPDFHNTPKRYARLMQAVDKDPLNRAKNVAEEIGFFRERESIYDVLTKAVEGGSVPERVTHNDTKLNNVMIDDATGEGVCVIDLDTVMPGTVFYDFGDLIRTGTNGGKEDARDLSSVSMRFDMFTAIADGYLEAADGFLNEAEVELLAMSGRIITLEIGIRFLTDHLNGDRYFKTHRPGQNLDRCRSQIAMARSIEAQMKDMEQWIQKKGAACVS